MTYKIKYEKLLESYEQLIQQHSQLKASLLEDNETMRIRLIRKFDLSSKLANIFEDNEIAFVFDLIQYTKLELKNLRGVGASIMNEIEYILKKVGYGFNCEGLIVKTEPYTKKEPCKHPKECLIKTSIANTYICSNCNETILL